MTAKTGMAQQVRRARGLFGEVVRLAEAGKRDARDVIALNIVLQALKDGHVHEVRVTPRLRARRRRINESTIVVTILVNYDDRMDSVPGYDGDSGRHRVDTVGRRTGTKTVDIFLRRFRRQIDTAEITEAFARDSMEPITPEELKALHGVPVKDLLVPIAALGAVWWDHQILCLDEDGGGRYLSLCHGLYRKYWGGWWFGARRKAQRREEAK